LILRGPAILPEKLRGSARGAGYAHLARNYLNWADESNALDVKRRAVYHER